MIERLDDQQRADKERASFDAAFIRAIDRQAEMVAHTPGWKPLIDLVWEELAVTRSAGTRIAPMDRWQIPDEMVAAAVAIYPDGLNEGTARSVIWAALQAAPSAQSASERTDDRVTAYIVEASGDQLGGGDDPVGFLIASHACFARDAARYRWLNSTDNFMVHIDDKPVRLKCGDVLDSWIDARIEEEKATRRTTDRKANG